MSEVLAAKVVFIFSIESACVAMVCCTEWEPYCVSCSGLVDHRADHPREWRLLRQPLKSHAWRFWKVKAHAEPREQRLGADRRQRLTY